MDTSWVQGTLYIQPSPWNAPQTAPMSIKRPLRFPTTMIPPGDSELELPDIQKYLPLGTDADAVSSLVAVYRSHCSLAIDNFRFCKTEKLCDSYKSLVGLLTIPGQKLLAHPSIAPWIQECDWYKYQKMIPMLDKIILTQVPQKAMAHMEFVGKNLCNWIYRYFQNQPRHLQDAMLGPTNVFVSIIDRFLRVNRATSDVAAVFEELDSRDQLWADWVNAVEPRKILQNALGDHGHQRCLFIITQDVRRILQPLGRSASLTGPDFPPSETFESTFDESDGRAVSTIIIERLVSFLVDLPARFPAVDARSLLSYISVVGSNISRNLTLNSTQSLGNWWRINLFIDEMSHWLAEKGGFLEGSVDLLAALHTTDFAPTAFNVMENYHFGNPPPDDFPPSRPRSSESQPIAKFNQGVSIPECNSTHALGHAHPSREPDVFQTMPTLAHQAMQKLKGAGNGHNRERSHNTIVDEERLAPEHDDSGIGMEVEDEFAIDTKYQSFVEGAHGSDPADVVVC